MALKYLIFTSLLLATVYSQDPAEGTTTAVATSPPETPDEPEKPTVNCFTSKYTCSDCNNRAMCVWDGSYFLNFQAKCDSNSHCVNGECVPGANCLLREFRCTQEGNFPDPFDCTKYHFCLRQGEELVHVKMDCGKGGSYDYTTNTCGYPLNTTACVEAPVPECEKPLQSGMLKSNPSCFYVCVEDGDKMRTDLYCCSAGKTFSASKLSCVDGKKKK